MGVRWTQATRKGKSLKRKEHLDTSLDAAGIRRALLEVVEPEEARRAKRRVAKPFIEGDLALDRFTLRYRNLVIRGAAGTLAGHIQASEQGTRIELESDGWTMAIVVAVGTAVLAALVIAMWAAGVGPKAPGLALSAVLGVGASIAFVVRSAAVEEVSALRGRLLAAIQREERAARPAT